MKKLFPRRGVLNKSADARLDSTITVLEEIDFLEFPPNISLLYKGSIAPEGWIEDTDLTSPDVAYIYIKENQ